MNPEIQSGFEHVEPSVVDAATTQENYEELYRLVWDLTSGRLDDSTRGEKIKELTERNGQMVDLLSRPEFGAELIKGLEEVLKSRKKSVQIGSTEYLSKFISENYSLLGSETELFKQHPDQVLAFQIAAAKHSDENIRARGLELLLPNVPFLQSKISENRKFSKLGKDAYDLLIHLKNPEQRRQGVDLFAEYTGYLLKNLQQQSILDFDEYAQSFYENREFLAKRTGKTGVEAYDKFLEIERSVFENFKLDPTVVDTAWHDSAWNNTEKLGDSKRRNLYYALILEAKSPGITEFLFKRQGVLDYSRYPMQLLLDQRENFEDDSKPYGLIIFPRDDHNGSFYSDEQIIYSVYRDVHKTHNLRVVECADKRDIHKYVYKMYLRYGKAAFGIIGAHGSVDAMDFGARHKGEKLGMLQLQDVVGTVQEHFKGFMEKGAPVVLFSCSTGVGSGMAEDLSKSLELEVIGPDSSTNPKEVKFSFEDGKAKVDVEYATGEPKRYVHGKLEN